MQGGFETMGSGKVNRKRSVIFIRRKALMLGFQFFDLAGLLLSFLITLCIKRLVNRNGLEGAVDTLAYWMGGENLLVFVSFCFIWHIVFRSLGLYRSRRFASRRAEAFDILKAVTLGTLIILTVATLARKTFVTPEIIVTFLAAAGSVSLIGRTALRKGLAYLRSKGRNLRFMVIVGTNSRALRFARIIESRKELGYRIRGFVDMPWSGNERFLKEGYPLLGGFGDFTGIINNKVVDEVMVCLPLRSCYDQANLIVKLCEEQGIVVRFLPDLFNLKLAQSNIEQFEDEYMITLFTGGMGGWQAFAKRIIDIVVSGMLLMLLFPVFLLIALIIKATSPGPAFFIQERVGLNKRKFRLYKFRTMVEDAEKRQEALLSLNEVAGPVFKIKDDPRVTPVGRLLRKTSLDELPQLMNVLKGDMSLVGPRPLPVRDYMGFDQDWHRRRFSVRPGITCLWQVNGRHEIPFEKWMELDMDYIDRWSFWLDIRILAKTISAVLRCKEAS
jgi:exopolysaccharide biosynthesis polyprenyl glycosylphosphotransferase